MGVINKGKKVYDKPMLMTEEFVSNEYVAACYSLTCDYGEDRSKGPDGNRHGVGLSGYKTCGDEGVHAINVLKDGSLIGAVEEKSDDLKLNLNMTDETYQINYNVSESNPMKVSGGQILYWTTNFYGTIYKHKGTVDLSEGKRVSFS